MTLSAIGAEVVRLGSMKITSVFAPFAGTSRCLPRTAQFRACKCAAVSDLASTRFQLDRWCRSRRCFATVINGRCSPPPTAVRNCGESRTAAAWQRGQDQRRRGVGGALCVADDNASRSCAGGPDPRLVTRLVTHGGTGEKERLPIGSP